MRVVHAMTKPVTSRMGRLGRSWPSSQARPSKQVVNFRQICSAGYGVRNNISVAEGRKEGDI